MRFQWRAQRRATSRMMMCGMHVTISGPHCTWHSGRYNSKAVYIHSLSAGKTLAYTMIQHLRPFSLRLPLSLCVPEITAFLRIPAHEVPREGLWGFNGECSENMSGIHGVD